MPQMNLKLTLMDVGNKLVTEHGFDPSGSVQQSCTPIREFTEWVNAMPEVQQVLREMGIEWPMPKYNSRWTVGQTGDTG